VENNVMIVKKIAKKAPVLIDESTGEKRLKRVCAYARVSTDFEDQKNSYEAQLNEYDQRIKKNPEWEFIGLYSDEGITGTCLKRRDGFKKMINDALNGKIDLILVKSVSRFARNTVDCLKTIRDLRAKNVEVFFDKEKISSFEKGNSDMILTFYASFAQEESKSISENVKWGVRKRMEKGDRKMNVATTLGYDKTSDGKIIINENEAKIIRHIFEMYLEGNSTRQITDYLNDNKIVKKNGSCKWQIADVIRILDNDKYVGDFTMQKTVVLDFLEHKAYKNDGLVDKYVVKNHHESIVSREVFEAVKIIKKENCGLGGGVMFEPKNKLTSLLYCKSCGRPMRLMTVKGYGKCKTRQFLTCKSQAKNDINYINCDMTSTLNYELTMEALKDVMIKFFKPNYDLNQVVVDSYKESIKELTLMISDKKKEIDEIDTKLNALIVLATNEGDTNKYKIEFNKYVEEKTTIEDELKSLKNELYKASSTHINSKIIKNYKSSGILTYAVIKEAIKLVIRNIDNSITFVLSNKEINIDKEIIDKISIQNPIYSSSVDNGKTKLYYYVVQYKEAIING